MCGPQIFQSQFTQKLKKKLKNYLLLHFLIERPQTSG